MLKPISIACKSKKELHEGKNTSSGKINSKTIWLMSSVLSILCEPWMCWTGASAFSSSFFLLFHLKEETRNEYKSKNRHTLALKQRTALFDAVDLWLPDLVQPEVVVEKLVHCPAAEVPFQRPGWRSSGNWAPGPGPTRHSLHRCPLPGELGAYLHVTAHDNTELGRPSGNYTLLLNCCENWFYRIYKIIHCALVYSYVYQYTLLVPTHSSAPAMKGSYHSTNTEMYFL